MSSTHKQVEELILSLANTNLDGIDISANKVREIQTLNMAGDIEAAKDLYVSSVMNAMFIIDAKERYADVVAYADKINGRKSAEIRQKDAKDNYAEWQELAEKIWKRNPWLSKGQVAEKIRESQKSDKEQQEREFVAAAKVGSTTKDFAVIKVYAVSTISRRIKKK